MVCWDYKFSTLNLPLNVQQFFILNFLFERSILNFPVERCKLKIFNRTVHKFANRLKSRGHRKWKRNIVISKIKISRSSQAENLRWSLAVSVIGYYHILMAQILFTSNFQSAFYVRLPKGH